MASVGRSNQNHTQKSRSIDYYNLNGRPIGEIAQFALYSGEEAACRDAEDMVR